MTLCFSLLLFDYASRAASLLFVPIFAAVRFLAARISREVPERGVVLAESERNLSTERQLLSGELSYSRHAHYDANDD